MKPFSFFDLNGIGKKGGVISNIFSKIPVIGRLFSVKNIDDGILKKEKQKAEMEDYYNSEIKRLQEQLGSAKEYDKRKLEELIKKNQQRLDLETQKLQLEIENLKKQKENIETGKNIEQTKQRTAKAEEKTAEEGFKQAEYNKEGVKEKRATASKEEKAAAEELTLAQLKEKAWREKLAGNVEWAKKAKSWVDTQAKERHIQDIIEQAATRGETLTKEQAKQISDSQDINIGKKLGKVVEGMQNLDKVAIKGLKSAGEAAGRTGLRAYTYATTYDAEKEKRQAEAITEMAKSTAKTTGAIAAAAMNKGSELLGGAYDMFILMALLLHLVDWWAFGFAVTAESVIIDFMIMLYILLVMNHTWDARFKVFVPVLIVFGLEAGWLNTLVGYVPAIITNSYTKYFFVKWAWPYWLIYGLLLGESEEPSFLVQIGWIVFILFWVTILIGPAMVQSWKVEFPTDAKDKLAAELEQKAAESGWVRGVKCWWETSPIVNPTLYVQGKTNSFQKCMNPEADKETEKAAGEIDKTITEYVKAELVNVQGQNTVFQGDSEVAVGTELRIAHKGKTIIISNVSCRFVEEVKEIGKVPKEYAGAVENLEQFKQVWKEQDAKFVYCKEKETLPDGTYNVKFEVVLQELDNYGSWSIYFMDKNELRKVTGIGDNSKLVAEMVKKWADEVSKVVGSDYANKQKVVSRCAAGMLCGKMDEGRDTLPIYGIEEQQTFNFIVDLENKGDGKISNIQKVYVSIPSSMTPKCGDKLTPIEIMPNVSSDLATRKINKLYEVKLTSAAQKAVSELSKDSQTQVQRCPLTITDAGTLGGSTPNLAVFELFTVYDYTMTKDVKINVKDRVATAKKCETSDFCKNIVTVDLSKYEISVVGNGKWNEKIWSSCFGGEGDIQSLKYKGCSSEFQDYVALPDDFSSKKLNNCEGPWLWVEIRNHDNHAQTTYARVMDRGPWYWNDPYWERGIVPLATQDALANRAKIIEPNIGKIPNGAAIDLAPAVGAKVGGCGVRKEGVDWRFVELKEKTK